ncbi:MAG: OmpH family outer membrane protein [Acidobacteriia bacterium]|nr:OmpH family outer membrane protein [Terriglobia bacterium]
MSFKDLIKNAIFEEEPQPAQPVQPPQPAPARTVRPSMPAPSSPAAAMPPATGRDNEFYGRLAKQTDLTSVPELAKIESFAAPLVDVIPDRVLRYKAAMATAQSQAGLTKSAILKGFDNLMATLDSASNSFASQSDEIGKSDVDAKTAQIADLNASIEQKQKEIADMQQQVKTMQSQAEASRTRLQQAKANFQAAYQRRKAEIEQQRREFENILQ